MLEITMLSHARLRAFAVKLFDAVEGVKAINIKVYV